MDSSRAGHRGRPVQVTTNSFEITTLPNKTFFQFDVVINDLGRGPVSQDGKPRELNFRRRQEIIDRLQSITAPQNFTPKALYDGKAIMFATHDLGIAGKGLTFRVNMSDRPQPPGSSRGVFEVIISRALANPVSPRDVNALISGGSPTPETATATNLLQLLIRQHSNKKYPNNNRAYFTNTDTLQLGGGIELWRGFFQSVRPTLGRMLINIDTSMAAMYRSGHFIDIAMEVMGVRNVRDLEINEQSSDFRVLESFVKKLIIRVTVGNTEQKRSIKGLISRAGFYSFSKDGIKTTVMDYFGQTHNKQIRYPGIVGVITSPKNATNVVVYPAEVCEVLPGQFYKKKIPERLYGKPALDFATMRPSDRLATIRQGIRSGHSTFPAPIMEYNQSEAILNSGMKVSPNPVTVQGRILETPTIAFGTQSIQPADGAWNVMNQRLNHAEDLKSWGVVSFANRVSMDIARRFAEQLGACCKKLGMTVDPPAVILADCHGSQYEKRLNEAGARISETAKKFPQVIIVILPQAAAELRLQVKHWGDVVIGVATQCVREGKIMGRPNDQYCNNVAIKINSRLGGKNFITKNSILDSLATRGPFMIVGADVTHPGPGTANRPSIASLAFSWDREACRYVALSRVQSPRQEIIDELKPMMLESLKKYYDLTKGYLPQQIYFFRDGVSEGELERVENIEINALREAIDEAWRQSKSKARKPAITFVIVGKRHHVRFFPEPRDGDRKSGNCKAGFVADRGLSSAFAKDFYLQSHGGLLGTSRPSHYIVLRNDNSEHIDDIQALAFELCHVYAKATRSVSIPAPVYYADLMCSRANFYFNPMLKFADDSTVSSGEPRFDLSKWQEGYGRIHDNLQNRMFFL